MTVRAISLTIVAFLLGALSAGGIGVRVIREVRTAEDATSLPAENIAPSESGEDGFHIDPFETLISSTSLTPTSITAKTGEVSIEYELVSLAPSLDTEPADTAESKGSDLAASVFPRQWVIETEDGPVAGGPENQRSRVATFDTSDSVTIDAIESVRIVGALAPFAFERSVILAEGAPPVEVAPGVSVELVDSVTDRSTTSVQVAIHGGEGLLPAVRVSGVGPGWNTTQPHVGGGATFTLVLSGDAPPQGFAIIVSGTTWLEIDGSFDVNLDGVR